MKKYKLGVWDYGVICFSIAFAGYVASNCPINTLENRSNVAICSYPHKQASNLNSKKIGAVERNSPTNSLENRSNVAIDSYHHKHAPNLNSKKLGHVKRNYPINSLENRSNDVDVVNTVIVPNLLLQSHFF